MDSLERGLPRPRGGITPLDEPPRSLGAFGANADDLVSTKVGEGSRGMGVPGLSGIPEMGQGVSRDGDGGSGSGGRRPWWGLGFGSHGASDGASSGMYGNSSGTSGSSYQQQQRFMGRVDMADLSGAKKPGGAVDTRRWRRQPLRGEVRDTSAFVIVTAFKVFRIMLLWIVLFCVDRLFQEWYTRRVLAAGAAAGGGAASRTDAGGVALASSPGGGPVHDGAGGSSDVCPPPLWAMVVAALAAEALVLGVVFGALAFAVGSFKADANTFVLDAPLLRRIATDYATSTAMILVLGVLLASVISSERNFRYSEDGLRAIRAFSLVLLLCAALLTTCSPTFSP
jgi:hypothetical protein